MQFFVVAVQDFGAFAVPVVHPVPQAVAPLAASGTFSGACPAAVAELLETAVPHLPEVVLIDVNKEKAYGEALDMQHSMYFMNRNIKVKAGDYADCNEADIVIITASAPMPKESDDRLKMLEPSLKIIGSIVNSVKGSGFNGIYVVISNPVDIMTYYTWRLSGLP